MATMTLSDISQGSFAATGFIASVLVGVMIPTDNTYAPANSALRALTMGDVALNRVLEAPLKCGRKEILGEPSTV